MQTTSDHLAGVWVWRRGGGREVEETIGSTTETIYKKKKNEKKQKNKNQKKNNNPKNPKLRHRGITIIHHQSNSRV